MHPGNNGYPKFEEQIVDDEFANNGEQVSEEQGSNADQNWGGFVSDEATTAQDIKTIIKAPPEDADAPLVEDDFFATEPSKTPIYKSIPLKASLAAVVAMIILIPFIGLFSGNLMGDSSPESTTIEAADADVEETEEEAALRRTEEENADLKRQLALQTQSFTASEMDEAAALEQSDARTTTQRSANPPTTPRPATSSPTSIRTVPPSPPPRQVAARPSAPPPPRRVAPSPPPRTVSQTPPVVASSRQVASVPIDVSALSNNGNYGSLPQSAAAALVAWDESGNQSAISETILVSNTIPVSVAQAATQTVGVLDTGTVSSTNRRLPATQELSLKSVENLDSQKGNQSTVELAASYEEERALILGDEVPVEGVPVAPLTIAPGSSVQAQLSQPISWTADMDSVKGALTLTSPLISGGYEILPQGTQIIVAVTNFSESGAVELQPTAIVLSEASTLDLSIPLEAIQILAADGGYPLAEIENGSERALRQIDRQQAVLGAISGASAFINRPDSESGFFGAGGSSYNRDYGDGGSVLAAIGGGAADAILSARSERLAAQGARIAARPYIWTLPEGTGVQIFFSQEVQL